MRVEMDQGVYRLQPTGPNPVQGPKSLKPIEAVEPRRREPVDVARTESLSFQEAGADRVADPGPARSLQVIQSLVAGQVNEPISFAPPTPPRGANQMALQAYFRQMTTPAARNEAALLDRIDTEA